MVEALQKKITDEVLPDLNIIDLEGEINTKGNYIYLSGYKPVPESIVGGRFEFTLAIVDKNYKNSDASISAIFSNTLMSVMKARVTSNIVLEIVSGAVKKKGDLFIFEVKMILESLVELG